MFKILLRPAMIVIPFVLGLCFPQAKFLNDPPFHFMPLALMVMVFLSSLQIRWNELALRKEHWRLATANLLMGVLPALLCRILFPDQPELYKTAFFTGIMPTATASAVIISFLGGNVGFALTGFALTTCSVSLALIVLLPLVNGCWSFAFLGNVLRTLTLLVTLPVSAAFLVKKFFPQAQKLPAKCKNFTFSLWSIMLFVIAAIARDYLKQNPDIPTVQILLPGVISLIICIADFGVGYLIGGKEFRRETSQLLGQKNTNFGMYLALCYATPLTAFGPIFYVLWHNMWNAIQLFLHDRRHGANQG